MKNGFVRFYIIIATVVLLAAACAVRLVDLQIVKGSEYAEINNERLVRAYSVAAPRGEILDNKGKPLVENRTGYSIRVQKIGLNDDELNRILYSAAKLAAEYGAETESSFPIVKDENGKSLTFDFTIEENGGTRPVEGVKYPKTTEKPDEKTSDAKETEDKTNAGDSEEKKAEKLEVWKKDNKLTDFSSAEEILGFYEKKYAVSSEYDSDTALAITAIRYAMDKANFSEKNSYKLCRDVDMAVVQQIKEQYSDFPGIDVVIEPFRSFTKGTLAAHILGRTGRIYAEEYAEMKNDGYGINDMIGKDGLEKVLEKYLKGEDGYKSVEMSRGGGVTRILQDKEPKSGNYAKLTLDRDLQEATENALKEKISQAVGTGSGAAIAVNPKTGGVLAMASYPTYDLSTFNEDYDKLIKSKSKPLINRVLNGTYSPGSTFKPLTSVAALESGTITPDTYITDLGKYTYYPSYQPTCLVYSSSGATHGTINVSQAIGVSCNYFFYDVGRRMGIEILDQYASNFGLGQTTGIELPESTGILASPSNRESAGGVWYPGDVLQAAIGQSDNLFTPAQLASYICTLLNKGKRYSLHLVDEVVDYDTNEVVLKKEPEVLSDNPISDSTYNAVTDGMRRVVTSGTASAAFASSKYKAAGKTGTAEVPDGADNVLFVGFAPYDDPEIVVAVIIEHGASSSFSAGVAREIFDAYMQIKNGEYKSALDKDESETADSSTDGDKIVTKPKKADNSSGNSDSKNVGTDKKSDSAKTSGGSSSKSSDNSKSENSGRQPENVQKSNNNSEGEGTL
ncbi:MAG: penicillin-binding transpeptidase domain-containing protein [Clostridia bacterium]|nr:penicillin-binding transpeptidase domain-containing protein [Clostridia bacterium]